MGGLRSLLSKNEEEQGALEELNEQCTLTKTQVRMAQSIIQAIFFIRPSIVQLLIFIKLVFVFLSFE